MTRGVVLRTGALGDFVVTLPVLVRARREWDHLTVIAPPRYQALFRDADAWIDSDGLQMQALFAGKSKLVADLGVAWTEAGSTVLREAGVAQVVSGVPLPPVGVRIHDHLWGPLLALWGPRDTDPTLEPTEAALTRLKARGGPSRPVVIAPGSGGVRKRWPTAWWHRVAKAVDLPVIWVTGPVETSEEGFGEPHWRDLDLSELIALAADCHAWLGPDSGPCHLASAAGARVGVGFNGATSPENWSPIGAMVFGAEAEPETWAQWVMMPPAGGWNVPVRRNVRNGPRTSRAMPQ